MPGARLRARSGYTRVDVLSTKSYATTFSANETPISEGGVWQNNGLDWTFINTSGGLAVGTQDGNGGTNNEYNDSFAHLTGYPADHQAEITLSYAGTITGANREAEVLLRWASSAHSATGYEIMIPRPGSSYNAQVVRWNGPYGDFTYIKDTWTTPSPQDGDIWRAKVVGNTVTAYLIRSGSTIWSDTADLTVDKDGVPNTPITSGNPGLGMFYRKTGGSSAATDFCATAFSATGL